MRHILFFLMLLVPALAQSQHVRHYDVVLSIDPKMKIIAVDLTIKVDIDYQKDTLNFILNKNAKIESVKLNAKKVEYTFQPNGRVVNRYLSDGRNFAIPVGGVTGETSVNVKYTCYMGELKANASCFLDQWIEIGQYTAWYPINFDYGDFTGTLTISAPKGFEVNGSGTITKQKDSWKMDQRVPTQDLVVIASNQLQKKSCKKGGQKIDLIYTALKASRADSIADGVAFAYQYFTNLFGSVAGNDMTIAVNPLKDRASYARKGFISIQIGSIDNFAIEKIIAHEIGHFWWNNASSDSWEDWLNESFAEFGTLLFIKQRYGENEFKKTLADFERVAADKPPLKGFNRSSPDASIILYRKGPLILTKFSERFGEKETLGLLKKAESENVKTTEELLRLLKVEVSQEAGEWLEAELKI